MMKSSAAFAISLVSLVASLAAAQPQPVLVAKVYPGAIAGRTKAGKQVPCGFGEDHHDAFCFLTKDPIEKVRAFYASEGVALDPIPVKQDQNAGGDGLYSLEEAVRLQLNREGIGSLYAAPVEFWRARSSVDEVSYFNSVVVISARTKETLKGSAQATKAAVAEDELFARYVLTPTTAAMMGETAELFVDAERLVPLYNKHIALQGAFFRKDENGSSYDNAYQNVRVKRTMDMVKAPKPGVFKTQDNKVKAIDDLLTELEKDAYPTMILIQRPRKDGVTRDPAVVQKEWHTALKFLKAR